MTRTSVIVLGDEEDRKGTARAFESAKGIDHMVLITDCMRAGGRPEGNYNLGDFPVIVKDGTARLLDESHSLAGSILRLCEGLKNVFDWGIATAEEAVRMAFPGILRGRRCMMNQTLIILAVLLVAGAALVGCSGFLSGGTAGNDSGFRQVTAQEAKELMDSEQDYVILDVRTEGEYAEGHVPGATLLPLNDVASKSVHA